MRRILAICLAFLAFGAMLPASAAGAEGMSASGKAQAFLSWDGLSPEAILTDTHDGDLDEPPAPVFTASWDVSATGQVSSSSGDGPRRRTSQSIRAPPQHL